MSLSGSTTLGTSNARRSLRRGTFGDLLFDGMPPIPEPTPLPASPAVKHIVRSAGQQLCHRCATINFVSAFSLPVDSPRGEFVMDIGIVTPEWTSSSCPLCRMFADMLYVSSDLQPNGEYHAYSLRLFWIGCTALKGFFQPQQSSLSVPLELPALFSPVLGLVVGLGDSLDGVHERGHYTAIMPSPTSEHESNYLVSGRIVQAQTIDFPLLNSWLNICRSFHLGRCRDVGRSPPVSLKVIDCNARKIVSAARDCGYVALSYVWGSATQRKEYSKPRRDTGVLPDRVPAVIEDAMQVVLNLGFEYLWADVYCIDQDDELDVRNQVRGMHLVYANAQVTIVAAAGDSAGAGLHGIGPSRVAQPHAQVGTVRLVSSLDHPPSLLQSSIWATRAWTYQEEFFSRRLLYFTAQQVHFLCHSMQCCESAVIPQGQGHGVGLGSLALAGMGAWCEPVEEAPSIWKHICKYAPRQLTYQFDILNGILGILQDSAAWDAPVNHLAGIPFQDQKTDMPAGTQVTEFARNLCWTTRSPLSRRVGFPTWSWTGWTGSIEAPQWISAPVIDPDFAVWIEADAGGLMTLEEFLWGSTLEIHPQKSSYYLQLNAWVITLQFEIAPASESYYGFKQTIRYRTQMRINDEYSAYAPLRQDKEMNEGRLLACPWDAIVLDNGDRHTLPFVIVVEWNGSTAERIGSVDFGYSPALGLLDRRIASRMRSMLGTKRRIRLG